MSQSAEGPAAGWYPDTTMQDTQRYWDGAQWSDHVAPMPQQIARAHEGASGGLQLAGALGALFLPIVGFIVGVMLMTKDEVRFGVFCILLSLVSAYFWAGVLTSGGY